MARRRMYGSATSDTAIAESTRVCTLEPLERVLQRERVQERREHSGVVRRGAVHALGRGGHAAVDVPGADDDRELRSRLVDRHDLLRDRDDRLRVDSVLAPSEERLARQLQEGAMELGAARGPRLLRDLLRARAHEPATEMRTNRTTDAPASASA